MGPHVTDVNFASSPELAIFAECRCGWTGVRHPGNPFESSADEIALQLASREADGHQACNPGPGRYVADHVA